jgi:CTP:molybdopterin cytidylyltransferase MocA
MKQLPVFILAAGASRRLGRPKQLLNIDGQPLIRRQCQLALDAAVGEVHVVLGDHADACRHEIADLPVTILLNDQWPEGLAASVRVAATKAAQLDAPALLLLHVDQYLLTAAAVRAFVETWRTGPARPHLARDGDHLGPPAIIPSALFPALQTLRGDRGARGVLGEVVEVALPGAAVDIDAPSQVPPQS